MYVRERLQLHVRAMSLPIRLAQLGAAAQVCIHKMDTAAWETLQLSVDVFVADWVAKIGFTLLPLDDLGDAQIAQGFVNRLSNPAKATLKVTLGLHSQIASVVFDTLCDTLKAIPESSGCRNNDQSNALDMVLGACVPADAGKRKLMEPLQAALKCNRRWIERGRNANAL